MRVSSAYGQISVAQQIVAITHTLLSLFFKKYFLLDFYLYENENWKKYCLYFLVWY